jgi:hypothetical protein
MNSPASKVKCQLPTLCDEKAAKKKPDVSAGLLQWLASFHRDIQELI